MIQHFSCSLESAFPRKGTQYKLINNGAFQIFRRGTQRGISRRSQEEEYQNVAQILFIVSSTILISQSPLILYKFPPPRNRRDAYRVRHREGYE